MGGFSTVTDSWSDSAATSRIRATAWVLLSPPSSVANTVSFTGPPMRSNSFFTAASSRAWRNAMARSIPALLRGPADDFEHPAIAGGIDARVDQRGTGRGLRRDQGGLERGLVGRGERAQAEGPGQRAEIGPHVAHRDALEALLLLLHLNQRERIVVEDNDDQRHPGRHTRPELARDDPEPAAPP